MYTQNILPSPSCHHLTRRIFLIILFFYFYLFIWWDWVSVEAHGLSCPTVCGIFAPRLGIKPASSVLKGGFLITGPPGKFQEESFKVSFSQDSNVTFSLPCELNNTLAGNKWKISRKQDTVRFVCHSCF